MQNKFYITTSIAYVNAKPHIGYAMELVQADVLARYHHFKGDDTFYLTGTDEHGSKLVQTAKEQGITAQQLVDQNSVFFRELQNQLNLKTDYFVRTTDAAHKRGAQKLWKKLVEANDIYKDSYEGLYCIGCEAFILEKDLIDGNCPNHKKPPEKLKEENYFFRLSKYSGQIKKMIESDELKIVPLAKKNEILALINEGLKDVSFSRPKKVLQWGVDVPDDDSQVMYVWCDALSNYITAIGYEEETAQFKKLWPADVHVIGKDILRFHSAIWIGMLISAGLPLPKAIYVHGYITSEGKKMSKSLGNVVDPVEYIEKFGADSLRFFLLKEIPTTDDGDFSRERFKIVYESDLANNIGNLVSRVIAMTHKYFDGKVPEVEDKTKHVSGYDWTKYENAINDFDLKLALEVISAFADETNRFVEEHKPWLLAKTDRTSLAEVIYSLLEMIRNLAFMLLSFMPFTAEKILGACNLNVKDFSLEKAKKWGVFKSGHIINKIEPLFPRLSEPV